MPLVEGGSDRLGGERREKLTPAIESLRHIPNTQFATTPTEFSACVHFLQSGLMLWGVASANSPSALW
jgi:hypothetical protein